MNLRHVLQFLLPLARNPEMGDAGATCCARGLLTRRFAPIARVRPGDWANAAGIGTLAPGAVGGGNPRADGGDARPPGCVCHGGTGRTRTARTATAAAGTAYVAGVVVAGTPGEPAGRGRGAASAVPGTPRTRPATTPARKSIWGPKPSRYPEGASPTPAAQRRDAEGCGVSAVLRNVGGVARGGASAARADDHSVGPRGDRHRSAFQGASPAPAASHRRASSATCGQLVIERFGAGVRQGAIGGEGADLEAARRRHRSAGDADGLVL